MAASQLFPPRSPTEARQEIEQLLHRSPFELGIARSRWRLQDIGEAISWLIGCSESCISKLLKRLGFSRKLVQGFIHSPDPAYRSKWLRILEAYAEAVADQQQTVLLFQDEVTYYRKPELRESFSKTGCLQRHTHSEGRNTKARVTAALNAVTGELHFLQRHKVGINELVRFYQQLRASYPDSVRLYLVQDNWPIHKHSTVMAALETTRITPLFLPTYASWLNPIEKVWRWLRQDILHNHDCHHDFKRLRKRTETWLSQFDRPSPELLHYVGLLTKEEFALC